MANPAPSLILWPTEQVAFGFANLGQLRAHVGLDRQPWDAVVTRTGPLQGQLSNLAALPPSVIRRAAGAARVIVTRITWRR